MRIPVERLIDGVVQTLTDAVLPDVATPFARGQLYAAVDVLRNLRDRVEPRADLAEEESASAAAALERSSGTLEQVTGRSEELRGTPEEAPGTREQAHDTRALAARIRAALAAAPLHPPTARAAALRAALVDALTAIAALPNADVARAARAPIAEHLGAQAMRDVATLKPSMLGEISRG